MRRGVKIKGVKGVVCMHNSSPGARTNISRSTDEEDVARECEIEVT